MGLKVEILRDWFRKPLNVPKFVCNYTFSQQAAASILVTYTTPSDYDLHADIILVRAAGTGGQTVVEVYASVQTPSHPDPVYVCHAGTSGLASFSAETKNHIIIQPNSIIRAAAAFSAGVSNNNVALNIHGFYIPRLEALSG